MCESTYLDPKYNAPCGYEYWTCVPNRRISTNEDGGGERKKERIWKEEKKEREKERKLYVCVTSLSMNENENDFHMHIYCLLCIVLTLCTIYISKSTQYTLIIPNEVSISKTV